MKRWKNSVPWLIILGVAFSPMIFSGCEGDDPVNVEGEVEYFNLLLIICQPLSLEPDSTGKLCVESQGTAGLKPTYTWSVEAGELLTNSTAAVDWKAPETPGLYAVTLQLTAGGTTKTLTKKVLVTNCEVVIKDDAHPNLWRYSIMPRLSTAGNLWFLGSTSNLSPRNTNFEGFYLYELVKGSTNPIVKTNIGVNLAGNSREISGLLEFAFPSIDSGTFVIAAINDFSSQIRQQLMTIFHKPFIGNLTQISRHTNMINFRFDQCRYPDCSDDGTMVVWEAWEVGDRADGIHDLYNIEYAIVQGFIGLEYELTCTESHDSVWGAQGADSLFLHRYYRNIKPMITPDESHILYFVGDGELRDTTEVFEPCLIPLDGARHPDLTQRRAMMVTERKGIFALAGVSISPATIFQWNPAPGSTQLGFIDNFRNLCFFDYTTEAVQVVPLKKVEEFAWSPDGIECVVLTAEDGIRLVSGATGAVNPDPLYVRERSTDKLVGINWSPDPVDPKIGFRLVRKGKDETDSWNAIVVYSFQEGSYYATPDYAWSSQVEHSNFNYTWFRVQFESDNEGLYAPIPVLDPVNYPGKESMIIHSHP
ncbi:MAG: hypothetical protein JXB45_01055 [Candidatus Krumholzibacteriota bacterium]|nr:hypothetical protein [Candidatus Krumholzibacteriota bacterium]